MTPSGGATTALTASAVFVAMMAGAGCGRETGGDGRIAQDTTDRRACSVSVPAQWSQAIADSRVDAAGTSTTPRAVSRTGEILAVRDTGTARDLVLIGADRSVRDLHSLPEPDTFVFGDVGIDDRWIVFAVENLPRNANGVLPRVTRIEVMDRQTGARRTVAEQSAADAAAVPQRNVLDSVVLSGGKVYWISRDGYNAESGVVQSFDPATGARADVASGAVRELRAGPPWSALPVAVPSEVAARADMTSLGTDGTAFGWVSGASEDTTAIGYWSPQTGVVTVTDVAVDREKFVERVLVYDSFVILDAGGSTANLGSAATFIDTRSGAVAALPPRNPGQYDSVVASMGGTLALAVWAGAGSETKRPDYRAGLLRESGLAPLTC